MLTPQDTPTARDVLRGHHQDLATPSRCSCGAAVPVGEPADLWLADHQLGQLYASGLAVVSVHGTAGVVEAAAAVVAAVRVAAMRPNADAMLRPALERLAERLEAVGR